MAVSTLTCTLLDLLRDMIFLTVLCSVLVGIGVELTFEVIAAAALLRKEIPALRVRVVNVTDLMILGPERSHPHSLMDCDFASLFTKDRRVHWNYHGYPIELRGLLFGRPNTQRFTIAGYSEEGTTTTPFDMMLCNGTSRYHVAAAAVRGGALVNEKVAVDAQKLVSEFMHRAQKAKEYALLNGQGQYLLRSTCALQFSDRTFITDAPDTYDTPTFD